MAYHRLVRKNLLAKRTNGKHSSLSFLKASLEVGGDLGRKREYVIY